MRQVYNFGICGHLHLLGRADFNNAIPFDQDYLVRGELLRAIEEAASTDCNPVIRWRARLSRAQRADQEQETGTVFPKHGGMSIVAGPH